MVAGKAVAVMHGMGDQTRRAGIAPVFTLVQVGDPAVPLVVIQMLPARCPTQMMSLFPLATAMAVMFAAVPEPSTALILLHVTVPARALVVRFKVCVPARRVGGLFGSRMNGAMKSEVKPEPAPFMPL